MKALKTADLPVLISVWLLCVATDWSTGTKIALNVAAVAVLCLKEVAVHRRLARRTGAPARRGAAHRLTVAA